MMRKFAIVITLAILISCEKRPSEKLDNQEFRGNIEIIDPKLKEILIEYASENMTKESNGVIIVDFSIEENKSIFMVYSSFSVDLKNSYPSFYLRLENTPVLFYTGLEKYIRLDSARLQVLDKNISPFLIEYEEDNGDIIRVPPNHNPVVWQFEILADGTIRREVLN